MSGLLHRSTEQQALTQTSSQHIHLHGDHGQGKTRLLQQLAQNADQPVAYVPCNQYDTEYKILQELHRQLLATDISTGHSPDQLHSQLHNAIEHAVIVLDHIDHLIHHPRGNHQELLTALSDIFRIVTVSAHTAPEQFLDARGHDTLRPETVSFDTYTETETVDILEDTTPNHLTSDAINHVASRTQNIAYAHAWIDAALIEADGTITPEDLQNCRRDGLLLYQDMQLADFTEHHHFLTEAIWQLTNPAEREVTVSCLYNRYTDICKAVNEEPRTSRRIYTYLKDLESRGIITTSQEQTLVPGDTVRIQLVKQP